MGAGIGNQSSSLGRVQSRRLLIASLAAALVGIAAVAVGAALVGAGEDGGARAPTNRGTVAVRPHAPALRGTDPITGATVSLARVKKRPVFVHVWASWCGACARGAAALQRFRHRHRGEAVILGIDYQDDTEDAKAFYEEHGWTFRSIADPDGRLAARLGVENVPATVVLDPGHLVVRRIEGPAAESELEKAFVAASGERMPSAGE
jgi:thiol-disulfide isomerase/thioredoxin